MITLFFFYRLSDWLLIFFSKKNVNLSKAFCSHIRYIPNKIAQYHDTKSVLVDQDGFKDFKFNKSDSELNK